MKHLLRLYQFLGSVSFAIVLIAITACCVILGTFIEAATQSHLHAALFTYGSPWFLLLLAGFFLNILISALRRWPFRKRHLPFLITHLGLLMILAGVMVKATLGVQGTLLITEGSGSHALFLNNTEAIRVEEKASGSVAYAPLNYTSPKIAFHQIKHVEHSQERLIPWFYGNHVIIRGIDPLPVYTVDGIQRIPTSGHVHFFADSPTTWQVYALITDAVDNTLQTLYTQEASLRVTDTVTQQDLGTFPLNGAITVHLSNGTRVALTTDLRLKNPPALHITLKTVDQENLLTIPLDGPQALFNLNASTPYLGALPITIDITMPTLFALVEDPLEGQTHLFLTDPHGAIWQTKDDSKTIEQVLSYEEGFAGYSMQKTIPWQSDPKGRKGKEEALLATLAAEVEQTPLLIEPLEELQAASRNSALPFGASFGAFLKEWHHHNSWLYPAHVPLPKELQPLFQSLAEQWSDAKREAAFLSSHLFSFYDPQLQKGIDPLVMLTKERWPLTLTIKSAVSKNPNIEERPQHALKLLTQQIISAAQQAPIKSEESNALTPEEAATGFSALLRAHGFSLDSLQQAPNEEKNSTPLVLETPLRKGFIEKPPLAKREENIPAITLLVKTPYNTETLHLTYDKRAAGLCWPCGGGNYLLRYQPKVMDIPYHLRLRQARQINYPDSNQPYSYEADILIEDRRTGTVVQKTLSMNHVHETDDHYRFYLSALYPPGEGVVKTVQIVANQDPAKYWLTYPGALLLSLGIISLFIMKYREGKKK